MELPIEWLPAQGDPGQLLVLLHGFGEDGRAMAPLAQALRAQFPQAAILAPDAPHASATGDSSRPGRAWYGIRDLSPGVWAQRVDEALAALHPWVLAQQQRLGVGGAATALGGFSQGAILALELATRHDGIAGRVLAFGGRYVRTPEAAPRLTTVHLFHGEADAVIPVDGSRDALEHLAELQGDATLDTAAAIGHTLHPVLIDCALHRLKSHIPLRTWQAAMGAARAHAASPAAGPATDD